METIVLYRHEKIDPDQTAEIEAIKKFFPLTEFRTPCCMGGGKLVICRYSALPAYRNLDEELRYYGSKLINSYDQHQWIANFDYYWDLAEFTFPSWNSLAETRYDGPFVVKGKTNSRKYQWNTHMYAETRADAVRVAGELNNDKMIGTQGVIYRKYVPLRTFEIGINGMRMANEWRFFFFRETELSHGFYWTLMDDPDQAECTPKMVEFAHKVAKVAAEHANFFVLDIAEKEDGDPILVEVNDGQCSGLSDNDPRVLWSNMKKCLDRIDALD